MVDQARPAARQQGTRDQAGQHVERAEGESGECQGQRTYELRPAKTASQGRQSDRPDVDCER